MSSPLKYKDLKSPSIYKLVSTKLGISIHTESYNKLTHLQTKVEKLLPGDQFMVISPITPIPGNNSLYEFKIIGANVAKLGWVAIDDSDLFEKVDSDSLPSY